MLRAESLRDTKFQKIVCISIFMCLKKEVKNYPLWFGSTEGHLFTILTLSGTGTTFFLYGCAKPIFYILSYLFAPLKFLLKILISGRALAVEGEVVVVIVNFRLGAFGFLTTQDTKIPQNAAMRDQNLALQWVQRQRDKIATFVFSFVAKNSYNVSRNEYF